MEERFISRAAMHGPGFGSVTISRWPPKTQYKTSEDKLRFLIEHQETGKPVDSKGCCIARARLHASVF